MVVLQDANLHPMRNQPRPQPGSRGKKGLPHRHPKCLERQRAFVISDLMDGPARVRTAGPTRTRG
jgi:hypothetical protein